MKPDEEVNRLIGNGLNAENARWLLARSIEWVSWPLFISQPLVPLLLLRYDWQPILVAVIVATILWRVAIATR